MKLLRLKSGWVSLGPILTRSGMNQACLVGYAGAMRHEGNLRPEGENPKGSQPSDEQILEKNAFC